MPDNSSKHRAFSKGVRAGRQRRLCDVAAACSQPARFHQPFLLAQVLHSKGSAGDSAGRRGGGEDSAPLPPDAERLFGGPLRRVRVDGAIFEPEAYARYYPDTTYLTPDELLLHYQVIDL